MKKFYLATILAFNCLVCLGQQGFFPFVITDSSDGIEDPSDITLLDVNNDGLLDIYIDGRYKQGWLANTGEAASFSGVNRVPIEACCDKTQLGDVNGDGFTDAVIFSSPYSEIYLAPGLDSDGTFGDPIQIGVTGYRPLSFKLVDIDGDGDTDVVGWFRDSFTSLGYFENLDGSGTMGSFVDLGYNGGSARVRFEVLDFDGDSDLDIVAGRDVTEEIIWLENLDGAATFSEPITIGESAGSNNFKDFKVADIDADGDYDVLASFILSGTSANALLVSFENLDDSDEFGPQRIIADDLFAPNDIEFGDIDSDGIADILIASDYNGDNVSWLKGMGGGDYRSSLDYPWIFEGYKELETADIDNDGFLDLVVASDGHDLIHVMRATDGLGNFEAPTAVSSFLDSPRSLISMDIDNDGDLDIVGHSDQESIDIMFWLENLDGAGTFGPVNTRGLGPVSIVTLEAIDIDADGDEDLILKGNTSLKIFENLDDGFLGEEQVLVSQTSEIRNYEFIDVDSDGDLDAIIAAFNIYLHLNNDGVFDDGNVLSIPYPRRLENEDINGDGIADLLHFQGAFPTEIKWIPGNGDGTFQAPLEIDLNDYEISSGNPYTVDMDSDGDVDLVGVTRTSPRAIYWIENTDGLGNFALPVNIVEDLEGSIALRTIDAEFDGDVDFVFLNTSSDELMFIEHLDASMTFADPVLIDITPEDMSLGSLGDLNNDGLIDLLATVVDNKEVRWYENLGRLQYRIEGNISIDVDDDGCDPEDLEAPSLLVKTENEIYEFATVTDANGDYVIYTTEGIYTTQITSALPNYYGPDPETQISDFTGGDTVDTADFCLVPIVAVDDVNIEFFPLDEPRPGFETIYQLVFRNAGSTTISGTIELNYDFTNMEFLTSSEVPISETEGQLIFEYTDLLPFESRAIDIRFQMAPPPDLVLGEELIFTGSIDPVADDATPEDNVFDFRQTAVNSYDPNDIRVLEGPEVLIENSDDYLNYIIRFENIGTASAIFIRVTNVLDQNLDWDSFQFLNASHPVEIDIVDGNQITFFFDDINLPPSKGDPVIGNGYIQYRIKPKADVSVGDIVYNSARIFFDFNPFIETNTVSTEYIEILSIDDFEENSVILYPNPATDRVQISTNLELTKINIYSILGVQVDSVIPTDGEISISIDGLSSGVYFLEFVSSSGSVIKRLIKK